MTDAAVALTKALIRCPSVTPEDGGALATVEAFLAAAGFACTRLPFEGEGSYPVDNLFATWGEGEPHLLFGGHTDVVPPGDAGSWSHPPFSAEEIEGEIWGRGAVDMKSGVAAFCAAAADLARNADPARGRLSLIITGDEEADSVNGTVRVLEWAAERGHRFTFGLVGEPTSRERFGDMLKVGRRGSLNATVTVTGVQGHTAYPHLAKNPLPVLSLIAARLAGLSLDDGSEHFEPTNLQLSSIETGNPASNVIPEKASLRFNVRFNNHWTADSLEEHLREEIAAVPARERQVEVNIRKPVSRAFVSADAAAVAQLAKAVAAVSGAMPERSTSGGTSDARYIADYCPVAEFGLVGALAHLTDERVPVSQIIDLRAVYAHFLQQFFQSGQTA